MTFPTTRFDSIALFLDAYAEEVGRAFASLSRPALAAAETLLSLALARDAHVYACGNGGSAAISNHMVCDHAKGIQTDTELRPRIYSLSSSVELITAVANDIAYEEIFSYQLATYARPGDVLITISSSGDSENVVRAALWAKEHDMKIIAFTGFDGGRSAKIADVNLHVAAQNYGVVEDVHQSLMHILAQYIRQSHMPANLVAMRKF